MNLHCFKLNHIYLNPLNMSNAGDFSWSWILKDLVPVQKEEEKFCRHMSTSSIKRQIRRFHMVVMQWTSKKCTKKRDARAELLFWSLNLLTVFWSCHRRSCLSSVLWAEVNENFCFLIADRADRESRSYCCIIVINLKR